MQIDHTPMDPILVDPLDREPIGRPWLTVAIDVHSRCISGFHVTLEVDADWPVHGKPRRAGVENGAEFHKPAR